MDLTEEQLIELDNGQSTDPFEDEMRLFLSEIRDVEHTDDKSDDNVESKIEAIKVNYSFCLVYQTRKIQNIFSCIS